MASPHRRSRDIFAQIAGHSARRTAALLSEPQPEKAPSNILPLAAPDESELVRVRPRRESPAQLRADLLRLRRSMQRFLANVAPASASTRQSFTLSSARWRLLSDDERSSSPADLVSHGAWKRVQLPHFGGPIGPATTLYLLSFTHRPLAHRPHHRTFLCFSGVDYRAEVFVNDRRVGSHEGFFAAFEFDVTDVVRRGRNSLLVRVENDAVCMGNHSWGQPLEGDKIYGATGPGWNEPGSGWHHCPPGMGIWQPVRLESRPPLHVQSTWIRPMPAERQAEVRVEVSNASTSPAAFQLEATVYGRNYRMKPAHARHPSPSPAGRGIHHYRFSVSLPRGRRWSPTTPWLHEVHIRLLDDSGRLLDVQSTTFGQRSFVIDEQNVPRGRMLLNGSPIRLCGANTMGFEQQRVLQGDLAGLRDDLLLARHAGINFLRFTQRPVQPEVYALCDALGLLVQTDLPLFGCLRRTQFHEALRQAGEMERLIRPHPSAVLVSFINEPFPASWGERSHRHLDREEMVGFLDAATLCVRQENPDRQVKPVDGDYDPPHAGLPDNHAYPGWYNGHGLDLGKLHKGFWIPVKRGWLTACGEFGSEGLDPPGLMRRRYPRSWLRDPHHPDSDWTPARIHHAQTGDLYPLWFDRQSTVAAWSRASCEHQAWVTRLMTEAFRRDRRMVSFAIHHFIDAFPAGWMKSIVDCERRPKPAYFAYRDALSPVLVSLRADRFSWWGGETLRAELWLCHDTPRQHVFTLRYGIELGGRIIQSGSVATTAEPDSSRCLGVIAIRLPVTNERGAGRLVAAACDQRNRVLHDSTLEFDLHPTPVTVPRRKIRLLGSRTGTASRLLRELNLPHQTGGSPEAGELVLTDNPAEITRRAHPLPADVRVVVLNPPVGEHVLVGHSFRVETAGFQSRHFVSRRTGHPLVAGFGPKDFRFWHDAALDRPAPLLHRLVFAEGWQPILLTGQCDWGRPMQPAFAAAESPDGQLRVSCVELAGRTATNPVARQFALRLLEGLPE